MGLAAAALSWRPHEFMAATPHEFWAAIEGYEAFNARPDDT